MPQIAVLTLEDIGNIGSALSGMGFVVWALSKIPALAKQIKQKAEIIKRPNLWIALIAWVINLFFILRGDDVTRLFIFSCVLNVALLQLIIIGFIAKAWVTYISSVADKN